MADPRNTYVNLTAPAGGYESQLADIKRRQKMAELLAQQGGEDIKIESVGGIPTPISPFQGLAKALQSGMGGYLAGKASEDEAALEKDENKAIADVFEGMKDTPDVRKPGVYTPSEAPTSLFSENESGGSYTPGEFTPGQKLSNSEKTNRLMAALVAHPKIAAVAPMYMQGMRNELDDTRYASEQKKSDTRFEASQEQIVVENKRNAANDKWKQAEALRDDDRASQAHQDAVTASRDSAAATLAYRQSIRDNKPEFNQQQGQAATFADRMFIADRTLRDAGVIGASQSRIQAGLGSPKVPFSNSLVSGDKQALEQAKRDFLTAQLRQESGAAISDSEFVRGDLQYFPQPGDDEKNIERKAKNREKLIFGMRRQAGKNYVPLTETELYPTNQNTTPTSSSTDNSEAGKRARLAALKAQLAAPPPTAKPPGAP